MKEAVPCDSSALMWLSTTWYDFLYRRRAMGMMLLFPHDVSWARRSYYVLFVEVVPAYLTFSLHGGNVPSCCGQCDGPGSCAWQLMNQGSFGGRSVVFSALVSFVFFVCSFLSSSLSFLQTVTSSLFHCFLRSLSLTPSQIKPLWQNDCL